MKKETLVRKNIPVYDADSEHGLSAQQVRERTEGGWTNASDTGAGKTEKEIVLSHCFTFFNLVFLALTVFLLVCGSSVSQLSFLVIVIINTVIGIVQEIRAKRAVDDLTLVSEAKVRVVRDSKVSQVPSRDLVRDDIVEFRTGDQICADGEILEGEVLVNESLITGEDVPISKGPGDELMSGSFLVAGACRIQLTHVGPDSFASKLALEAKKNPRAAKSGMMRSLDKLIRVVGIILIPVGVALFIQQYQVLHMSLKASAESTAGALVGMIPEGLYLLTSMAMAVSARKLTKQKVLVQNMNCIETLARVDVLCVDKTGTITEPKMEVSNVVPLTNGKPEDLEMALSSFYAGGEAENDTAKAMQEMFVGRKNWRVSRSIPFTSQTKWSAKEFVDQGTYIIGAPEFVMGDRFCEIEAQASEWTALGYRVLLVAKYAGFPDRTSLNESALTPIALVTLTNRIRAEAPKTFAYFKEQGVAIKVISGDNPATVADVAQRAGIPGSENYVDATTLKTDKDIARAAEAYTVFGRVTPEQKKKLVQALKKKKHTVAMTGDGVNDVLAMKEADCGIAMASGSQAASQVAKLVLLESDFSVMPSIVDEGRRVINNIQRAAALFLAKNIFSFFVSVITIMAGLPFPLTSLHLTVISALTIGVPSFFLAMEPNYQRVTGRFLPGAFRRALPGGLTNIFVVMAALLFMALFGEDKLPLAEISTISTAILSIVGLLILYQVGKPMGVFRWVIWWSMAVALVACFTAFAPMFDLHLVSPQATLVLATLLIMTPTVFFAIQRVFDFGDRVLRKLSRKHKTADADL